MNSPNSSAQNNVFMDIVPDQPVRSEGPDPPILDCIMSIITLAILVVSFGLLGAMVDWFAYEDVAQQQG